MPGRIGLEPEVRARIARRLYQARQGARYTQAEAAEALHVDLRTYTRYEAEEIDVSLEVVLRAVRHYRRPINWFVEANPDRFDVDEEALTLFLRLKPVEQRRLMVHVVPVLMEWGEFIGGDGRPSRCGGAGLCPWVPSVASPAKALKGRKGRFVAQ